MDPDLFSNYDFSALQGEAAVSAMADVWSDLFAEPDDSGIRAAEFDPLPPSDAEFGLNSPEEIQSLSVEELAEALFGPDRIRDLPGKDPAPRPARASGFASEPVDTMSVRDLAADLFGEDRALLGGGSPDPGGRKSH